MFTRAYLFTNSRPLAVRSRKHQRTVAPGHFHLPPPILLEYSLERFFEAGVGAKAV
jgi:hypothetical protein